MLREWWCSETGEDESRVIRDLGLVKPKMPAGSRRYQLKTGAECIC